MSGFVFQQCFLASGCCVPATSVLRLRLCKTQRWFLAFRLSKKFFNRTNHPSVPSNLQYGMGCVEMCLIRDSARMYNIAGQSSQMTCAISRSLQGILAKYRGEKVKAVIGRALSLSVAPMFLSPRQQSARRSIVSNGAVYGIKSLERIAVVPTSKGTDAGCKDRKIGATENVLHSGHLVTAVAANSRLDGRYAPFNQSLGRKMSRGRKMFYPTARLLLPVPRICRGDSVTAWKLTR